MQLAGAQSTAEVRSSAHQALYPFRVLALRGPPPCRTEDSTRAEIETDPSLRWMAWTVSVERRGETACSLPTTNIGLMDPGGVVFFRALSFLRVLLLQKARLA